MRGAWLSCVLLAGAVHAAREIPEAEVCRQLNAIVRNVGASVGAESECFAHNKFRVFKRELNADVYLNESHKVEVRDGNLFVPDLSTEMLARFLVLSVLGGSQVKTSSGGPACTTLAAHVYLKLQ